ncbi:MAG: hypothetical protein ACKVUS_04710 [Saprospiraceae bacterium]
MPTPINLGANLPVAFDWATNIFTDLMKQSRAFSAWEDPAELPLPPEYRLDENGYLLAPFKPFGVVVKAPLRIGDNGEYRLRFKGKAIASALPSAITVRNLPSVNGWQVADLTIPLAALHTQPGRKQPILMLRFHDLQGESVRDISLINKLHIRDDGTAPTFHPTWMEHLRRFKVLRFMNWMSFWLPMPKMDWADRPQKSRLSQGDNDNFKVEKIRGVAAEYIVELANELKCDIWVNIPPLATDDYVQGLAKQLKAGLPATAKVYTEYGNEIWATGNHGPATWQGNYNVSLTAEEIERGNSNLNADGTTDMAVLAMRRYARRTKEIGDIFVQVFGTGSRNTRVRPVYCYQGVNPFYSLQPGLDFLTGTRQGYGVLPNSIWGISPKTAVDEGILHKPKADITAADLIQNMREGLGSIIGGGAYRDSVTPLLEQVAATAAWHNVAFAAYEGGIGFTQTEQIDTSVAFRMMTEPTTGWAIHDICSQYLQSWFSYGNDNPMCWFLAGITDWGGAAMTDSLRLLESLGWADKSDISGLTWSITEQNTLPIQAIDNAIGRGSFEVTAGISVPGRIDARRHTEREANWERTLRNNVPWQPEGNLYLVNALSAKQYSFQLVSEKNRDFETKTEVWVNNALITTVVIPQGVGSHTSASFRTRLRKGMNALRMKYSANSMGNYHLEVR